MSINADIHVVSKTDPSIHKLFPHLLASDIPSSATRKTVTDISAAVIKAYIAANNVELGQHVILIPILRAALPMYVAACALLPASEVALVRCSKDKEHRGPESVMVEWMGRKPIERAEQGENDQLRRPGEQQCLVLDTVLATGDTVLRLCDDLWKASLEKNRRAQVVVLCCYASPEALARIAAHSAVVSIFVARQADTVDEQGYLVPYTHGDMGDKLFGERD